MTRSRAARPPVLGLAGLAADRAEPGAVRFPDPPPLIGGIGARTAIVALVLYALLPILRNTYTGIRQVDPAVKEAARASA